jgi:hypothetical protein
VRAPVASTRAYLCSTLLYSLQPRNFFFVMGFWTGPTTCYHGTPFCSVHEPTAVARGHSKWVTSKDQIVATSKDPDSREPHLIFEVHEKQINHSMTLPQHKQL